MNGGHLLRGIRVRVRVRVRGPFLYIPRNKAFFLVNFCLGVRVRVRVRLSMLI